MVQQLGVGHLVRPRTTVTQDTNHRPPAVRKSSKRSFVVLSLCGACLFLLVLSICLVTSLVLVGKNLASASAFSTGRAVADDGLLLLPSSVDIQQQQTLLHKQRQKGKSSNSYDNTKSLDNTKMSTSGSQKIVSKVLDQLAWRLPTFVRPTRYELRMAPDFETKQFEGKVRIELEVSQTASFIAVHANKLSITGTQLERWTKGSATGQNISIANAFSYPKFEYWVTEPEQSLEVGSYVLTMNFSGGLTDRIVGFYQSSYLAPDKKTVRYMATSKFEPTYARQAFPCFDEPAMKAKFKISIVRPLGDNYIALSNMNEESFEVLPNNKALVHFNESVPMSTYLSCFIVSDFQHKEAIVNANGIGNNFTLRAFATPAQLEKVTFALETAKVITEYYIQYFKEEYPLPKLDMAAIPDFVSGAMEHWGLVTYRETSLLYDPAISSTNNRRRVAEVIAHELAHMWFGNLVTMAWWDELWLNEGFASYIEAKGVDAALPDWKMMDQFIFTPQGVMGLDSTLASHPIVQTAENPDQITELFDSITYSKGASVIRMLEDFVGADVFSLGVSNYLKKHKYSNAVTEDLLHELEQVQTENLDIKFVMATWTKQMGYPVINVERVSANQYRLTQKRFLSNPENEKEVIKDSEFNYRWYVPITYTTDAVSTTQRVWFKNDDNQIILSDVGTHKWIKLNKDQIGYYRVNYPKEMWQELTDALIQNVNQFSVSDRGHLLNDVFSLAEATQVEYSTALELTRYLAAENEYVPWSVASSKINELKTKLYYTEHYSKYAAFGKSIIETPYNNTEWTVGNNQLENHKRTIILSLACSMGIQQCIDKAGAEFTTWLANPTVMPHPDLRELIYYYGMFSAGNEARWFQMWELFKAESDAQEKSKLMYGLTAIQVPWILSQFVEFAEDESNIRSQDYFTALQNIAANRVGESIVWDYVRENWPRLVARFGLNERYLGRMIPSITGRFSTELRLQEMRDFFAKYPEAGAGAAAREQALSNVQNNINWLTNNKENIGTWLKEHF